MNKKVKEQKPVEGSQDVLRRLDALIAITLETSGRNGKAIAMGTRIKILSQAGIRPIEISRILGKSQSYVTSELVRLKKARGT